jgi:hypothetical protein
MVLDGTLIVLLAATLGYCTLLYRRLAELRAAQASMKKLIGEFGAATERAQAGLLSIKTTGTELSGVLAERIEKGRAMADELRFINEAANKVADKLDRAIGDGRAKADLRSAGIVPGSSKPAASKAETASSAWVCVSNNRVTVAMCISLKLK